jgi:hypothetical protein
MYPKAPILHNVLLDLFPSLKAASENKGILRYVKDINRLLEEASCIINLDDNDSDPESDDDFDSVLYESP